MIEHRARRIIERYKAMKTEKYNWNVLYEKLGEYVFQRKKHFTSEPIPGEVLNEFVYDDTASNANHLLAASMLGALWPAGAKSFRIGMPKGLERELDGDTEEVKRYYQFVTDTMADYMDNPKAGLRTALEEYMLDQGVFGISGIHVEDQDDFEVPVAYRAVDAKVLCVEEGNNGFVNCVYIEREYTLRQMVERYGIDALSKEHRKSFESGTDNKTKVKVLNVIEPRMDADPYGFGAKNMPVASIHIDLATEKILKESGYLEHPVSVCRFWKAMGEKYGRSPAMNALPSILEANALGEAWILAVEKTLDPPLAVTDDATVGGGVVDTSPGAINVISVSGAMKSTRPPIEPMFLVGDLNWTAARRAELAEIIGRHFFQDRLTGLGKDERMQNPEVAIVNDLRGMSLNPVYARQMAETFVPLIESTFNKLRRKGLLGVIEGSPEEEQLLMQGIMPAYIPEPVARRMATGQEVYKIEFVSPATRIMQADELRGIEHFLNTTIAVAAADPSVMDIPDMDFALRRIQELDGAPREIVRSMEKIRKIRQDRQQAQQAAMEIEAARQNSETARNMGQAATSVMGGEQKGAA